MTLVVIPSLKSEEDFSFLWSWDLLSCEPVVPQEQIWQSIFENHFGLIARQYLPYVNDSLATRHAQRSSPSTNSQGKFSMRFPSYPMHRTLDC